jgi:hypothetical protein
MAFCGYLWLAINQPVRAKGKTEGLVRGRNTRSVEEFAYNGNSGFPYIYVLVSFQKSFVTVSVVT